ncbi:hypothetical protein B0H14DRAFT_2635668 [Mycena olivaceomarginata]|nr:hypothetical protein B0H14DRAFT_2635668 [Mycena olivaceomarginata]
MERTTRSGAQWSAWELDGVASVTPDFFQSKVSLAPHLAQALVLADLHADALDSSIGDEDAWGGRTTRPVASTHPPIVFAEPAHSTLAVAHSSIAPRTGKKARRQRSRVAAAKTAEFGPPPKTRHTQAYDRHHTVTNPTAFASVANADGCIVAILLGRPDGGDWDDVMKEARRVMDQVRARGEQRGVFIAKNRPHCRGNFYTLQAGFTKGPGQKNRAIKRITGFQSSGLARYLPKLYRYQATTMKGLCRNQPELEHPFDNSVFPTVTLNLGPNVVTPVHVDMLNNPFGMCAITSNSNFDSTKGGHIYMELLKIVCEFPSGSTILLLSGTCGHGEYANTAGQKSLFDDPPDGARQKREIDGVPGTRATWAMGLLSKADELEQDREDVFGGNSLGVPLSSHLEWVPTKPGGRRQLLFSLTPTQLAARAEWRRLQGSGPQQTDLEEIEPRRDPAACCIIRGPPSSTKQDSCEASSEEARILPVCEQKGTEARAAEEAASEARWQARVDEFLRVKEMGTDVPE